MGRLTHTFSEDSARRLADQMRRLESKVTNVERLYKSRRRMGFLEGGSYTLLKAAELFELTGTAPTLSGAWTNIDFAAASGNNEDYLRVVSSRIQSRETKWYSVSGLILGTVSGTFDTYSNLVFELPWNMSDLDIDMQTPGNNGSGKYSIPFSFRREFTLDTDLTFRAKDTAGSGSITIENVEVEFYPLD